MLTASDSMPNMQQRETAKSAPTPENWHGVSEGLNIANRQIGDARYQDAVDTLKAILEFAPSEPKAWKLLGELLEQHGHTSKAEACHKKANALSNSSNIEQTSMPASERLAKLLWSQGETDAARAMLAVLLMRNPDSDSLIMLGESWNDATGEAA